MNLRIVQTVAHIAAAIGFIAMQNWWALAWVVISAIAISEAAAWESAYRLRCQR